eukprot:5222111-Pyramimonas_sp.AAC.1
MHVCGQRLAPFAVETACGGSLEIAVPFLIPDVRRPLISVGQLTSKGSAFQFGSEGYMGKGGPATQVSRRRNGYFATGMQSPTT